MIFLGWDIRSLVRRQLNWQIYHPSSPIDTTRFLVTSADYPGIHLSHKHYICPLMPLSVHLLPLTGSAHRADGELGFNRWKRIWVYPSVAANARCGDHNDPQLVNRTSEWVSCSKCDNANLSADFYSRKQVLEEEIIFSYLTNSRFEKAQPYLRIVTERMVYSC